MSKLRILIAVALVSFGALSMIATTFNFSPAYAGNDDSKQKP